MSNPINRRDFGRICAGLAAVAVTGTGRLAHATDLPHVDEAAPQAQALGYVHDANKTDKAKFPAYVAGSICGGCQLYQGGAAEWGGILDGLALTGHFLARDLLHGRAADALAARERLVDRLKRAVA